MKVIKFGKISLGNEGLEICDFVFSSEGKEAPYSSSDILGAISDFLTNHAESFMIDENFKKIE